ncbi:hypothetical protein Mag101_03500 [Microbulbifer agarilyticus]|uniref:AI-2E family transporter n=1 Tax=Microbulbifer agarilyticus TaxID=260552 RepID=A0A1Q2M2N6_9GAMM|nr:AI-2E family transporter [Microbulbifer agarilyticus]AQQ66808.1 hypothetical protein Mag101_03500 [Microbulbifer agarilyticus]
MPDVSASPARVTLFATGLATLAISALFVGMVRDFLVALLLAAIFSAMAAPLQEKVSAAVGGRQGIAAVITLVILLIGVLVPTLAIVFIAATQASDLVAGIGSFIQRLDTDWTTIQLPDWVPFREEIEALGPQLAAKAGELASRLASLFLSVVSAATKGTAHFFLNLFVMAYAMVFFLQEKTTVLAQLARYTGLTIDAQNRLVDRVVSVSCATIKGTLVIGVVQGALGGIAFSIVGIQAAAFWGVVMAFASIIPAVGPSIIWIPAVLYLAFAGETVSAIGLAAWCAIVVGLADNLLRPWLVGREAKLSDLMVLIGTFGGLAMFGAVGLIIGPVITGVFITVWDIFQKALATALAAPVQSSVESNTDGGPSAGKQPGSV